MNAPAEIELRRARAEIDRLRTTMIRVQYWLEHVAHTDRLIVDSIRELRRALKIVSQPTPQPTPEPTHDRY